MITSKKILPDQNLAKACVYLHETYFWLSLKFGVILSW